MCSGWLNQGRTDKRLDGWTDETADRLMDGQTDRRTDGKTDGCTYAQIFPCILEDIAFLVAAAQNRTQGGCSVAILYFPLRSNGSFFFFLRHVRLSRNCPNNRQSLSLPALRTLG